MSTSVATSTVTAPGGASEATGFLEQEARALLTRLDSVRPFAMNETMVPAAAPLPNALSAVEHFLLDGRRELRQRVTGFLDWLRRHERVEVVEDAPGPRVRQVSNAYRLSLPARAAQLLGHWLSSSPPLPDDVAQEREDRAAWLREHKASLPLSELPLAEVEDDRLARVLGELGRAVAARARAVQGTQEQEHDGEACS